MYIDVTKAKFQELIDAVKAKNKETENKLVWCLALIGGALIVALIAYAVYRFLKCHDTFIHIASSRHFSDRFFSLTEFLTAFGFVLPLSCASITSIPR